jgi:hypothetical protein
MINAIVTRAMGKRKAVILDVISKAISFNSDDNPIIDDDILS